MRYKKSLFVLNSNPEEIGKLNNIAENLKYVQLTYIPIMNNNIFAEITECNARFSKFKDAPPIFSSANEYVRKEESKILVKAVTETANSPKYRIYIDSVDKIVETSLLRSSFIVYRVRFTRMSDLQSHSCWKRFKEINIWFTELQSEFGEELDISTLQFPDYSDGWLSMNNQKDPHSEFVQRRKIELEIFFRNLFGKYPSLLNHPRVVEFFELNILPAETMNVIATRAAARDLEIQKSHPSSFSTIENPDSNLTEKDCVFDRTVLTSILVGNVVYDVNSAAMIHKCDESGNEFQTRYSNKGKEISVAEIMNFTDNQNKRFLLPLSA